MSINNISSFWQSPLWADILTQTGQAEVMEYTTGGSSYSIERRRIWKGLSGLYMLGVDGDDISPEMIETICRKYSTPSDLFLQLEPIKGNLSGGKIAPFRRFLEPKTAILKLKDTTEEQLLGHFAEKGRYNIRVAERRGLTTQWVHGDSVSSFTLPGKLNQEKKTHTELFFDLLQETTERDGFSHNSLSYYQTFIRILEKNNSGGLLLSIRDGTIHAAGIFVYYDGQAIYYYGASSNSSEIRRDHGTYLLQWEAIREALRRGCTEYDFLGISSHTGDKLAGVTQFKMRFAPDVFSLPLEKIIVFRPIMLFLLQCVSRLRKLSHGLYRNH